jgi:hypothetical protein
MFLLAFLVAVGLLVLGNNLTCKRGEQAPVL